MLKDIDKFKFFLIEAKKNTYAGDVNPIASSRPDSIDLQYTEGDLEYIDSYFGSSDFIGEEIVYKSKQAIWGMNYYGKMKVETVPEGFIFFLKEALKKIPLETPYRGPIYYKRDQFKYYCYCEGDITDFLGREIIKLNNKVIYELFFHGGEIK